jgi:sugar phosphate permease
LAERVGANRALASCFAASGAALFGFAALDSESARIVLWGANGLFQAMCYPLCVRALGPYLDPKTRGGLLGLWTTSQAVGGVLANSFAATMLSWYGWKAAFAPVPAAMLAGACLLLLFGLPPENAAPTPAAPVANYGNTYGRGAGEAAGGMWDVAWTPGLAQLGAGYFAIKLTRYTMLFWLPLYLNQQLGYSAPAAGFAATLFDVPTPATCTAVLRVGLTGTTILCLQRRLTACLPD